MTQVVEGFVLTVFDRDKEEDIIVAVTTDVEAAVTWASEVVGGNFVGRPFNPNVNDLIAKHLDRIEGPRLSDAAEP